MTLKWIEIPQRFFPAETTIVHKDRKPISVCTTKKGSNGEWLVGYNRWKENTCIVGIDGVKYLGERYYCLCTTHGIQPLR